MGNELTNKQISAVSTDPQEQQPSIQEAVNSADTTSKARQEAYADVQRVLDRAAKGAKIDQKDMIKAVKGLFTAAGHMDSLVRDILSDTMTSIKAIASSELNMLSMNIKLKTFITLLERKGVCTEEELMKVHDEEIFPEVMKGLGIDLPKSGSDVG